MSREKRMRRAKNIVWTAAGAYDFTPEFLAFYRDGTPDRYLNTIVGLVHRHYDAAILGAFFHSLDDSLLRDTFLDVVWMGLEHAVYEREIGVRPALFDLREEHARRFLADQADLSMQELMARDDLVHTLRAARCRACLTGKAGLHNPWERSLYAALAWEGSLATEAIVQRAQAVLHHYFRFHFRDVLHRHAWHISLGSRMNAWIRRAMPMEHRFEDGIVPVHAKETAAAGGSPLATLRGLVADAAPWTARLAAEIAERFGAPLIAERERSAIECMVCRGAHRKAHLAFTRGRVHSTAREANAAYLASHARVYETGIRQLAAQLKNTLAVTRAPMTLDARCGRLVPSLVWRALHANDGRVFHAGEETPVSDFSVTLLLDASASRKAQQGAIAAQAYLVAAALSRARIPVQVVTFSSVKGCTVLVRLKPFVGGEAKAVLRYEAHGWNRDGLALRAVRPLLAGGRGRPLLIVFTDAHPADTLPLADGMLMRGYAGARAVQDAADAVRELRSGGVRVAGIVESVLPEGETDSAARMVFGHDFTRIDRPEQLAARVGALVARQIRG